MSLTAANTAPVRSHAITSHPQAPGGDHEHEGKYSGPDVPPDKGERRLIVNRTSGDRDATQPQVRDQADDSFAKATNGLNSGEAAL
jgi:hypothetical protein